MLDAVPPGRAFPGVRSMKFPSALMRPLQRFANSEPGEIGLYLSNERLNMVQFDNSSRGPAIRAVASSQYHCSRDELMADPRQLKALLHGARSAQDFSGRRAVSCLRSNELQIFPISYLPLAGQDDAAAIVGELRERLKGQFNGLVVDYLPIRKEDGDTSRREALVTVASREVVARHLEVLERVGLQLSAIDIGPAALARLVSFVNHADPRTRHLNALVINFGSTRSYLSVVWGRRLILDREIEFGERALVERVARVLNMSDDMGMRILRECGFGGTPAQDASDPELARTLTEVLRPEFNTLAAEVNKTLIYTASRSRGRSIDQIYLLGSVSSYPGVARLIQGMLAIPVEALNPFRAVGGSARSPEFERLRSVAGIALACGLALRGFHYHD